VPTFQELLASAAASAAARGTGSGGSAGLPLRVAPPPGSARADAAAATAAAALLANVPQSPTGVSGSRGSGAHGACAASRDAHPGGAAAPAPAPPPGKPEGPVCHWAPRRANAGASTAVFAAAAAAAAAGAPSAALARAWSLRGAFGLGLSRACLAEGWDVIDVEELGGAVEGEDTWALLSGEGGSAGQDHSCCWVCAGLAEGLPRRVCCAPSVSS
jgi:hypothetical protein